MASKEKIRGLKLDMIENLQTDLVGIERLETGRLYEIQDHNWGGGNERSISYGFVEAFNLESFRVKIVASNTDRYKDSSDYYRSNIGSWGYNQHESFKPAKKEDLPLLVGMAYRSADFEKILSGKKRLKLD